MDLEGYAKGALRRGLARSVTFLSIPQRAYLKRLSRKRSALSAKGSDLGSRWVISEWAHGGLAISICTKK